MNSAAMAEEDLDLVYSQDQKSPFLHGDFYCFINTHLFVNHLGISFCKEKPFES